MLGKIFHSNRTQQTRKIEAACITHMGYVRERNEDNLYFLSRFLEQNHDENQLPQKEQFDTKTLRVIGVFDGMGGESAGDLASYFAVLAFDELYSRNIAKDGLPGQEEINRLLNDVSYRVYEQAVKNHYRLIGSTVTLLFMYQRQCLIVNLGDSPMYLLRSGTMQMVSHPHTDAALLAEQNIRRKPALTQFLGINTKEMILEPYILEETLQEGDVFLLCSDGLTDMVSDSRIIEILGSRESVQEISCRLRDEALDRGGRDNITIAICRVK